LDVPRVGRFGQAPFWRYPQTVFHKYNTNPCSLAFAFSYSRLLSSIDIWAWYFLYLIGLTVASLYLIGICILEEHPIPIVASSPMESVPAAWPLFVFDRHQPTRCPSHANKNKKASSTSWKTSSTLAMRHVKHSLNWTSKQLPTS